jgi:hypothetical protein
MTATTSRQLVLPGQAAAPDGPVDLTAMFVMHHAFRRDLRSFALAAERTPVSDRATWRALHRRWQGFSLVLHHHHSGEDAGLWPLLLERSRATGDEAAVATLHAMEAEHEEIDPLLEACAADLAVLAVHPDEDARAALHVRLVGAGERLGAHLSHEERDALALVQSLLTPQDWATMEEEHFNKTATTPYVRFVVPWLLDGLPQAARVRLRSAVGRVPDLLAPLLRPAYRRLDRKAFRYLT